MMDIRVECSEYDGSTFVLDGKRISRLVADSIRDMIRRANATSVVDVVLICRVNGQEKRYEADWIKWLEEVQ